MDNIKDPESIGKLGRLADQLSAELGRRNAAIASTEHDLAKVLRAQPAVEPHRDWHGYRLGADLVAYGLTGADAYAMMGLRALAPTEALRLLTDTARKEQAGSLGELLVGVVDCNRDTLEPKGWLVSWHRRWTRYQEDLASWQAQGNDVRFGNWRSRPMTAGQRELVRETATSLHLQIPLDLDRGAAADWLERHGANLNYTREF